MSHPSPALGWLCTASMVVCALMGGVLGSACAPSNEGVLLNDVHSRLNPTRVARLEQPRSTGDVIRLVEEATRQGMAISISGGRHSMGGQQFGSGNLQLDMSLMNRVLALDRDQGVISVEAGITWPELIDHLLAAQPDELEPWSIVQKQTGADRLSLGGALSTNIHGRGLSLKPIVQDVAGFGLVGADAREIYVSREQHPELFGLVIGGYGLFGVITRIDLRLQRRIKLSRDVTILPLEELPAQFQARIDAGYLYGDLQFKTDSSAEDFLLVGVFSTYRPVPLELPMPTDQQQLSAAQWQQLLVLAHTDKARVFSEYSRYYLSTHGQLYWSDTHQLSFYDEHYEAGLRDILPDYTEGSLMISELYVPRDRLVDFMEAVAEDARQHHVDVIYGTIRLVERDDETFLPWAKQSYACVIFNLRVEHSAAGLEKARQDFRRLIDRALERGGSYFLTYHRWATKEQLLEAYPQFAEFMRLKLEYDPEERFQSDWYRHYRELLRHEIAALAEP